jgi:hypothetical protein
MIGNIITNPTKEENHKMEELPDNCMGQEQSTRCIYYEKTNEPLDSVIERLDEGSASTSTSDDLDLTTDDITTTSLVRNPASLCSSQITTKDFTYTLSSGVSSSTFSWSLLNITSNLPDGYTASFARILATGVIDTGSSIVFDSNSLSAGLAIELNRYPLTIDFSLRVASPCGDINMSHQVYISSPAQKGTYGVKMMVNDLMPGSTNELTLTQQLNTLEANVQQNQESLNSFETVNLNGAQVNINQAIAQNSGEIAALDQQLNSYELFDYVYDQNGTSTTETVSEAISGLYTIIKGLQDDLSIKSAEIETLQAQVASLQA